ncbi:hypothetical protein AB0M46_41690 [Dactylosporangium sp. NPDC051485]|uniref:hypothetical protein n=1 Tax=Dactylosporangium sp. NPDC051485 TaxID=3154846 RepID=UPI0034221356
MTTTAQPRARGRSKPKSADAAQETTQRPSRARKATPPQPPATTAAPAATATAPKPSATATEAEAAAPQPQKKAEKQRARTARASRRETAPQLAAGQPGQAAEVSETERVTWHEVPMPHVKVPVVHMGSSDAQAAVQRVRWTTRTVMSAIPIPRPGPTRLLYYGGVGALAVFGVLEWPVALAAAAGVWVATRARRTAVVAG